MVLVYFVVGPPAYRTSSERESAEVWTSLVWTMACTAVVIIFGMCLRHPEDVWHKLLIPVPLFFGGGIVYAIEVLFLKRYMKRQTELLPSNVVYEDYQGTDEAIRESGL